MQKISFTSNFNKILLILFIIGLFGYSFQLIFESKIILTNKTSAPYKIHRILYENHLNEIPIFGSSRAEGTFIPTRLGSKYYNYGISGIRDNVILFFLNEECKKKKNTPIVINFDMEGLSNSIGDPNNYILNCNNSDIKKLMDTDYQFYYSIPIIKYYGNYMFFLKEFLNSKMMLTKYQENGASIEKNILIKEKFDKLVIERNQTTTTFNNNKQLEINFINIIRSHPERKFILIIPPYHKSYFTKYYNMSNAKIFFKNLNSMKNVSILNYSQLEYNDSLYFNTTHLNYNGAIQFCKLIKPDLDSVISTSK